MRSIEYPKTDNLFVRDPDTHKLKEYEYKRPEFAIPGRWQVTEKIDGMNIRICWSLDGIEIRGRTDRAQVPKDLEEYIRRLVTYERLHDQFVPFMGLEHAEAGASVTLFGEGYGAGIQKGGRYSPAKQFALFDVMYHWPRVAADPDDAPEWRDSWCQPSTTRMLGRELGLPLVPLIKIAATLPDIISFVKANRPSLAAWEHTTNRIDPEGIIARTDPYLYNERGQRVMFKLKGADLL